MSESTEASVIRDAVDWDRYEVIEDFEPPNPSLIVEGTLPFPMRVAIESAPELFVEPDYWPAFVVGYHGPFVVDVIREYSIQKSLSELSTGKKGIELIGKTKNAKIDLP